MPSENTALPARTSFFSGGVLGWRTHFGFGRVEWCVLAGYAALVGCLVPFHEPWADEAQAWLIARDNSLWQIFRYRLHYEGAPGLWHLCLHVLHALGGGYTAMHWMGAAFALAGVAVFLRWAPFPLLLRVLLPFTFFFAFQYAVVARSYTLYPMLAFGLCALFAHRSKALWFALLAGLLANISLQGTVHSFVLMVLYAEYHLRNRAEVSAVDIRNGSNKYQGSLLRFRWRRAVCSPAAGLYAVLLLVAALTAIPPPDASIAGGPGPVSGEGADRLLGRFPGFLPASEYLPPPPLYAVSAAKLYKPVPLSILPPDAWVVQPSALRHPGEWAGWAARHPRYDSQGHLLPASTTQTLLLAVLEFFTLATAPVSTFKVLACGCLLVLIAWLWQRRGLQFLLPWLGNIVVSQALWVSDHHMGLLLVGLLSGVWLAAPGYLPSRRVSGMSRGLDDARALGSNRVLILLLTLVCVEQIGWTVTAVRGDTYGKYDPSTETAAFLQAHGYRHMASFDFEATGVQPYFARNPFFNLPHSYWTWTLSQNANGAHVTTIMQRPDVVLFSEDLLMPGFTHNDWAPLSPLNSDVQSRDLARNPIVRALQAQGYQETHRFCGERYFRFKSSYKGCNLIFEPVH